MNGMYKNLILTSLALASLPSLHAGSFQLNLQGIRQTAMAGSGMAKPWDMSTIFYNPGGLSRMDKWQVYASGYLVSPTISYSQYPTAGYQYDAKRNYSTPFAIYLGGPISKDKKWSAGLGVFTPFGSGLEWDNNWVGKYIIQNISLQTIQFQPTVSYKICEHLSIGAGINIGIGNMEINKALPIAFQDGSDATAKMKGNALGWGFNIGMHYKPTERIELGISYRHGANMKVNDGTATFLVPNAAAGNFPLNGVTGFNTNLALPHILNFGAAINATEKLTITGDLIFAGWSRYKSLDFNFDEQTAAVKNTSEMRNYKNTLAVRVGANYKVTPELEIMAGAAYDPTPTSPNYTSPDAVDGNRWVGSAGLAYTISNKISIMGAVQYTHVGTRNVSYAPANFNGAYQMKSITPALGVSFKF